ncbi:U-box domain-containing protein 45-like [Aristolochia californica]|uniref:U-box domain-containing protein 45-like n=1 Tax=Aristolochia californica TaxID=171875 RepID=UPI0035DA4F13
MSNSSWFSSYSIKLRFFARVRRFLQKKASCKSHESGEKARAEELVMGRGKDIEEASIVLQRSVKKLHFGDWEERETAAKEITTLAAEDLRTRKSLAALGVIPTLVGMLNSDVAGRRMSAVRALVELSNGTQTNKSLMVEAGIFARLSLLIRNREESGTEDVVSLLLSLSSLPITQTSFPTTDILPFLTGILDSGDTEETKLRYACMDTLYNLSTVLDHTSALVSSGVVQTLVRLSSDKNTSERALATLGNLVVSMVGKQAMETHPSVPNNFIEILMWDDKPKCQELAAYILMILAHGSSAQREKMARSGIVPVLLEVALLASALAQKRALKILQCFRDDRQMKIGAHSGPQTGRFPVLTGFPVNQKETQEGRREIKMMVKQSLDKNMESIMRRANALQDPSTLKGLIISSSSKSFLPL